MLFVMVTLRNITISAHFHDNAGNAACVLFFFNNFAFIATVFDFCTFLVEKKKDLFY